MTTTPQTETTQERLARARAALGAAERRASRWGGRIDRTALAAPGGLGGPTGLVPAPSARPSSDPASAPEAASVAAPDHAAAPGHRLAVPAPLADLVPGASLRAGSSLALTGGASTSLMLALAAAAAGQDAWCAIAGMPSLGLRAALDAGLDPCRLAIVPDAAEHTAQVLSSLIDGVGVVVLGAELDLVPALWRTLVQRARTRDALVLAVDPPGRADLRLSTVSHGWTGLGSASGRLRRHRVQVVSEGRGIAGLREAEVLLPEVRGMIASVPPAHAPESVDTPVTGLETAAASAASSRPRMIRRAG